MGVIIQCLSKMFKSVGISQAIALDLHSARIAEHSALPIQNIPCAELLARDLASLGIVHPVIVAPDIGGAPRALALAQHLKQTQYVILAKHRQQNYVAENYLPPDINLYRHANGRVCVIVDDILASGYTLITAAQKLQLAGASKIYAYCTHAVFTHGLQLLNALPCEQVVVTNTIALPTTYFEPQNKLRQINIASLFSSAIRRICT